MTKRSRVLFTYTAEADSSKGRVFRFLGAGLKQSQQSRQRKEKAIDALLAFWLPGALAEAQIDRAIIRQAAEQSIQSLIRQINAISLEFGLETPQFPTATTIPAIATADNSTVSVVPEPPTAESEPERPPGIWLKGIEVDERELLGDLYDLA